MSVSDENMSSPPSILTIISAGSCTPSSLPSAGSTPSSIPSAGSTPYQFVSQEELSIIKPLTPDQQSLPPFTPDQPITPELCCQIGLTGLGKICEKNILAGIHAANRAHASHSSPEVLDDLNERRENCLCIMCSDNQVSSELPAFLCKNRNEKTVECCEQLNVVSDYEPCRTKRRLNILKVQKKNKLAKMKEVCYQSEITGDPESTDIKIKIKLAHANVAEEENCFLPSLPTVPSNNTLKLQKSCNNMNKRTFGSTSMGLNTSRKKKKCKISKQFTKWGPPLSEVKGEPQSQWAYNIAPEILEKIFRWVTHSQGCIPFLHRAARVCRLWRKVSICPKLWYSIDLGISLVKPRHRTENRLLWIIENRLRNVEELYLAGLVEALTPYGLRKISESCLQLRVLNIGGCYKLHSENLNDLLSHSRNLEYLDLTNIMGAHKPTPRSAVGQQTLSALSLSLNGRLTHLILANNTLANVQYILSSLSTNCHNLQVLDLSSVETVGHDSIIIDIEKFQIGCSRLRILRIANSRFKLCQNSMTVQTSSPGFAYLEELSLAVDDKVSMGMNDEELERILKNSNKLCLLDVRGCHNITDSSLIRIPPWDIEHLFLAGGSVPRSYSDRLELVIRKWYHSLVELDLSWTGSSETVDAALFALAEEENDKLRLLNLCGSSVNFEPVKKLLDACRNLHWLNLTSCRSMPRGMKRLYENLLLVRQLKLSIKEDKYSEQRLET